MSQTSVSGNNKTDALLSTYQWGTANGNAISLTYSFPTTGSTWNTFYSSDQEPFSPNFVRYLNSTQRQDVRDALSLWSNVANISFTEVAEPAGKGDIRVTYSTAVSGGTAAWAYFPPSSSFVLDENGDIWINPDVDDLSSGGSGFSTVLHEAGHALGLKHPFDAETQNSVTLPASEDTTRYTLMSYTDYEGAGNVYTPIGNTGSFNVTAVQPTTPMLYDILAIQFLYGANTSYNTGDDTYTFSSTAGQIKTIWDAGGTDTFDLSNQSLDMSIDLNAGAFSSLGVRQSSLSGPLETAVENIAIAYNVAIENAVGGSGNDTITGNSLANRITGGGGNDRITGGQGDDTAVYTGNRSDYQFETVGADLQITGLSTGEGVDTLSGIENVQFSDQLVDAQTLAGGNAIPTTPSEVDKTPTEGNSNHTNYFLLQIGGVLSVDASVSYETRDGTATAGEDYVATNGTATITAGETTAVIGVEIIGDTLSEGDETFLLAITNPTGGNFPSGITEITATRTIVDDDAAASSDIFGEVRIIGVSDMDTVDGGIPV